MSSERSLNAENRPLLGAFLLANVVLLVSLDPVVISRIEQPLKGLNSLLASGLTASVVASLFAFVLNGLIPPHFKAALVFWRKPSDALPGRRAFSEHAIDDPRIDVERLRRKLRKFPTDPEEQNKVWYRLLKKHEVRSGSVVDAHQQYLLSRDMTAMTAVLFIGYNVIAAVGAVLESPVSPMVVGDLSLMVEGVILSVVARFAGYRLVRDVLAREAAS